MNSNGVTWFDKLTEALEGPQLVNDSKTPSGRVHVGALRGVLIHDVVYRALRGRDVPVRYTFGVDDYDPLDELPADTAQDLTPYLGVPLCNVPTPTRSQASDLADHYITEFFAVFRELKVDVATYRMRDVYRTGQFNDAIDKILSNAKSVREIYRLISGSQRPDNWLPFQVICEVCGRIGTTEVTHYSSGRVTYHCRPDLVAWARGCGYVGDVSPFYGHGKLPWKLEWAAKWHVFGVTIEGAGKDHNTRGGSREVAAECLRRIFGGRVPYNIPYEFFLVGGAKMSSSRGIGVSARAMTDLLPPEVLRFLVVRTAPNQPVNFAPDHQSIVKLFNDYDRCREAALKSPPDPVRRRIYEMCDVDHRHIGYALSFQLAVAFVQMPHIDPIEELKKRKGQPPTEDEKAHLRQLLQSARYWLEHYASEEDKFSIQTSLPVSACKLSATQCAFLHRLAAALGSAPWKEEVLQVRIFDVARRTPITQPLAFQAIYQVLIARDSGPKAGNLLAFLDRAFVIGRLKELPYELAVFWQETAITQDELEDWFAKNRENVTGVDVYLDLAATAPRPSVSMPGSSFCAGLAIIEFEIQCRDGKVHMKRLFFEGFEGFDLSIGTEIAYFREYAKEYIEDLQRRHGFSIREVHAAIA